MSDVFISYSRLDSDWAGKVDAQLRSAGITCFLDRNGLSGGDEFPSVLAEAILQSRLVLFLASSHSYESRFSLKEVLFAVNNKGSRQVFPLLLDDSAMPKSLELLLSDINWRRLSPTYRIEAELVEDIRRQLNTPEPGRPQENKPSFSGGFSSGFKTLDTLSFPWEYGMSQVSGAPPAPFILPTLQNSGESSWYYVRDGQRYGPYPKREIERLYQCGSIDSGTLLWAPGMKDWTPLQQCPGIF